MKFKNKIVLITGELPFHVNKSCLNMLTYIYMNVIHAILVIAKY